MLIFGYWQSNRILSCIEKLAVLNCCILALGACKVRNEIETKRNETKSNETKRNQSKRNEIKRNETKNRNETKRNPNKTNINFDHIEVKINV